MHVNECLTAFILSVMAVSGHDWQHDTIPTTRTDTESKKNKNICLYNDEKSPGDYEVSCILSMTQTMDNVFCKYSVMNKSLPHKLTKYY
jgi:hypothetical protein